MSHYIGRFAPSPTGPLHNGSLLAAVASYIDARANNGKWLLRIEDVDETRCKPAHTDDILRTLNQFGFLWDGDVLVQSTRKQRYAEVINSLIERQLVYACVCSRREIADSATRLDGVDGAIYPGTCRHAAHDCRTQALRFDANSETIRFNDRCQGLQTQIVAEQVGDFILRRRDGLHAYQLAVVVDDHDCNVTHVVRGADLLDSTPRQILLQQRLGYATPSYLHIPVLTNADGQKLSKQTLAPSISTANALAELRRCLGWLGQTITPDAVTPATLLAAAAAQWQPQRIPPSMCISIAPN